MVLIKILVQDDGMNKSQCSSFLLFMPTIQLDLGYDAGYLEP
jgi:hypothetical protein